MEVQDQSALRKTILNAAVPIARFLRGVEEQDGGRDEEVVIVDALRGIERKLELPHRCLCDMRAGSYIPAWEVRCVVMKLKSVGALSRKVEVSTLGELPHDPMYRAIAIWLAGELDGATLDDEGGIPQLEDLANRLGLPTASTQILKLGRGITSGCSPQVVRVLYDAAKASGAVARANDDAWQAEPRDWAQIVSNLMACHGKSQSQLSIALKALGGQACGRTAVGYWKRGHNAPPMAIRGLLLRLSRGEIEMPANTFIEGIEPTDLRSSGSTAMKVIPFGVRNIRQGSPAAPIAAPRPTLASGASGGSSAFDRYREVVAATAMHLIAKDSGVFRTAAGIRGIVETAVDESHPLLLEAVQEDLGPHISLAAQFYLDMQEKGQPDQEGQKFG